MMRRQYSIGPACRALLMICGLGIAGGVAAEDNPRDPYEGFNRSMFAVNEVIDKYAAKPLAQAYDSATPLPVKAAVGNFFGNAGELWVGANSALQGKFSDAGIDLGRLLINSTLGIFGLFDVASELGLERHDEDFGQTLGVWGVGEGGFVFWPGLGPRTVRDTAGWAVDYVTDPVRYFDPAGVRDGAMLVRFVDIRASLLPSDKVIDEAALDRYAYIRDAYLQRRRNLVHDGRPPRQDDDY